MVRLYPNPLDPELELFNLLDSDRSLSNLDELTLEIGSKRSIDFDTVPVLMTGIVRSRSCARASAAIERRPVDEDKPVELLVDDDLTGESDEDESLVVRR